RGCAAPDEAAVQVLHRRADALLRLRGELLEELGEALVLTFGLAEDVDGVGVGEFAKLLDGLAGVAGEGGDRGDGKFDASLAREAGAGELVELDEVEALLELLEDDGRRD